MDLLTGMHRAIDYIENNLEETIDYQTAAQLACCSLYQFQRLFSCLADISLAEYIRRRRLTRAASELQTSSIRIIDLALKYGYESPVSFSRAFHKLHHVTPTAARNPGTPLKVFPRITFQLTRRGDQEINYKIEEKPAWSIIGKSISVSTIQNKNWVTIPHFWSQCRQNGTLRKLACLSSPLSNSITNRCLLGVCRDFIDDQTFSYIIATENKPDFSSEEFETYPIPALTWAVFRTEGSMPHAIHSLFKRIYGEFFPTSGYSRADGPDIEVYPDGDVWHPDYQAEIWVPVEKALRPLS